MRDLGSNRCNVIAIMKISVRIWSNQHYSLYCHPDAQSLFNYLRKPCSSIYLQFDSVACCTFTNIVTHTPDVEAVWLRDVATNTSQLTLHHVQLLVMVLDIDFPQGLSNMITPGAFLKIARISLQELYLFSKVTLISTECEL